MTARLSGSDLTLAYDSRVITSALDVTIPDGSFTVIVGPNACGKSTLLRALSSLLTPPLLLMSRRLRMLEMGDDTAHSLGVKAGPTRLILVLLAVAICAVATAATGPVAFVALAAPQITKRLARSATLPLLPSMITGALLMVVSDFVAQRLLAPAQMPVGVVTGAVGGAYLAWLLSAQWRKGAS